MDIVRRVAQGKHMLLVWRVDRVMARLDGVDARRLGSLTGVLLAFAIGEEWLLV